MKTTQMLLQRPRFHDACDKLREIATNLGPSSKLPTMVELRRLVGVSNQTLHNAVRQLEQEGVLRSVHGVGIFTAEAAGGLQKGNLALVLRDMHQDLQGAFWGKLLAGMRQEAMSSGRNFVIIDETVPFTDWQNVDGILTTNTLDLTGHATSGARALAELPRVAVINPLPDVKGVYADDFGGVYQLTQYLIQQGHRRIAYLITENPDIQLLQDRRNGYLKALEDAGIEFDGRWIRTFVPLKEEMLRDPDHWWVRCGERELRFWLNEGFTELGCTALLCINDEAALGAIEALRVAGLRVPEDISVAGFDGTYVLGVPAFQLTTAQVPLLEIGRRAARMLIEWIDDPEKTPRDILMPAKLIIGGSSAACPTAKAISAELTAVSA